MPHSQLKTSQLRDFFSADIYQLGEALQQSQQVFELESSGHISARVNDPDQGICQTFISVKKDDSALDIDGECSCEQETNCVHVVATLLQLLDTTCNEPAKAESAAAPQPTVQEPPASPYQSSPQPPLQAGFDWPAEESAQQIHYVLSICTFQRVQQLKLSLKLVSRGTTNTSAPNKNTHDCPDFHITPLSCYTGYYMSICICIHFKKITFLTWNIDSALIVTPVRKLMQY